MFEVGRDYDENIQYYPINPFFLYRSQTINQFIFFH